MRTRVDFKVSEEQRQRLEAIANDRNSKVKHAMRARIVLLSDDRLGTMAIMAATGASKATDPALAGAVHAGVRGGSSARQYAQVGDSAGVREDREGGACRT